MRKTIYSIGVLILESVLSVGLFTACGDQFQEEYPWMIGRQEDMDNTNEEGAGATDITVLEKELRGAIPYMISYTKGGSWQPHAYQYQRSNSIDNYAGYWTTTKSTFAFGGPLPTLYTFPNDYLGGPMDNTIFTQSYNAIHHATELGKPEWRAIALIIQAYQGHEIVDFYGAAPFSDWRNLQRNPPLTYERGEDIYTQIFNDLDEAIRILKERQPSRDEIAKIEDLTIQTLSNGDWRMWVKFANSIKMRMAMNIVKYDASTAQQKFEQAVTDDIGVLNETDARDIAYYQEQNACCLWTLGNSWHDIRLGATLENILKRYNHPLLTRWFDTNSYPIKEKGSGIQAPIDVYGVRAGINMRNNNTTGKDKGGYGPFSTLSGDFKYMPQAFFKRTESLFLMAEGALRGWNTLGRTAKDLYEAGIRLCFQENGITDETVINQYMEQTKAQDIDYVDPYNNENNIAGRVKVGVKWDETNTNEEKLEKIITQKYIANFPMSAEAWTTFRRTGYPRIFPVDVNNMKDQGVDTELQLRRIPIEETTNNTLEIASLVQALGQPNTGASRVFWDKPTETRGEQSPDNEFALVIPVNF
ncbi:SusD/RagB family nutrient-binding outer membrane lipoprotein [Barnesiella viscericola]|uniref:SusD/RagB family nutrient-binding outer membrane lipoprotein n=1 Tax=Barnesiella viscericola TaxID=397865 RepID=UPI0023571A63|nr:SusD/RagB family nutrient-binding outer membrane lipoprotein [Barnesiella viscericola]